jgi:predicted RNA-binding Zn-ribbon protein involved in translation (DUF1610 family)
MGKTHRHHKTIINGVKFACPKCVGHILRAVSTGFTCYESIWECHADPDEGVLLDEVGKPQREEGNGDEEVWYECNQCGEAISVDTLATLFGSAEEE